MALNMLTYVWLSELPGSDELLFRYIRKTFDNKNQSKLILPTTMYCRFIKRLKSQR